MLGSGLALVPLGRGSFTPLVTVTGQQINPLTIHKICFVLWLVVTGAHVLARTVPALQLTVVRHGPRRPPGGFARAAVVVVTVVASITTGVVVTNLSSDWTSGSSHAK